MDNLYEALNIFTVITTTDELFRLCTFSSYKIFFWDNDHQMLKVNAWITTYNMHEPAAWPILFKVSCFWKGDLGNSIY